MSRVPYSSFLVIVICRFPRSLRKAQAIKSSVDFLSDSCEKAQSGKIMLEARAYTAPGFFHGVVAMFERSVVSTVEFSVLLCSLACSYLFPRLFDRCYFSADLPFLRGFLQILHFFRPPLQGFTGLTLCGHYSAASRRGRG
jgi:hypothetical protein